jgi:hypothetical protein
LLLHSPLTYSLPDSLSSSACPLCISFLLPLRRLSICYPLPSIMRKSWVNLGNWEGYFLYPGWQSSTAHLVLHTYIRCGWLVVQLSPPLINQFCFEFRKRRINWLFPKYFRKGDLGLLIMMTTFYAPSLFPLMVS